MKFSTVILLALWCHTHFCATQRNVKQQFRTQHATLMCFSCFARDYPHITSTWKSRNLAAAWLKISLFQVPGFRSTSMQATGSFTQSSHALATLWLTLLERFLQKQKTPLHHHKTDSLQCGWNVLYHSNMMITQKNSIRFQCRDCIPTMLILPWCVLACRNTLYNTCQPTCMFQDMFLVTRNHSNIRYLQCIDGPTKN